MLKFSMDLVLKSIEEAGNTDKLTQDMIDDLKFMDGKEAVKSGWDDLVYDREMYLVPNRNGKYSKVERRFLVED